MTFALNLLFLLSETLAAGAGLSVAASVLMPGRAPENGWFLGVTVAVAAIFLLCGFVLDGVRRHAGAIAKLSRMEDRHPVGALPRHAERLILFLLVGGVPLCVTLAVSAYAILARINQGFAVFG